MRADVHEGKGCLSRAGHTLEVRDLVKSFNGARVVDGLSFRARPGEILALLGPNGAGKSTTVKILYGALRPDEGKILYGSKDFEANRRSLKLCIGVCSQNDTLDYDLTVRENLFVFGTYYHKNFKQSEASVRALLSRFHLEEYRGAKPRILSGGLKRRLQIARALVNDPDVLFLDEPTTGLDPHARRELWNLLHELRSEGITILLTTHYMEEAEALSDHVIILDRGKVIEEGAPKALIGGHFGPWALQIRESDRLMSRIHASKKQYVRGFGQVSVFGEEAELERFSVEFAEDVVLRRRSNLEDLFIKLTGRGL